MIKVDIIKTFLINIGKEFVVILRSSEDKRALPISIGQMEAQSIALQLNGIPFPRPLTHDLFKTVISEFNGTVIKTEICDLKDNTFYARLTINCGGKVVSFDARPSDAIAIALRFSAPIYIEETVMEEAGIIIEEEEDSFAPYYQRDFKEDELKEEDDDNKEMTSLEILQKKLERAIKEERYEDAAKIRDEIKKLTTSN
ncbi:MAG: bifunctional nuclease family protein [Chitinispirillaceae bacterium]|nr:bifunctional nuclease family protein [Chitinispirillaceae bacterium]